MIEIKSTVGIIAVALVFIGYIPYIRDIIKGKTIPHVYSWILWEFVGGITFALQISYGAGFGAYVTLAAELMGATVVVLSLLLHRSKFDITKMDTIFFLLAFVSLGFWLWAKQPVVSIILATVTELLGFAPTIRKTWHKPYSETLSLYTLNTLRFGLAFAALQHYSFITAMYPITWSIANGFFAIMLIVRRRK